MSPPQEEALRRVMQVEGDLRVHIATCTEAQKTIQSTLERMQAESREYRIEQRTREEKREAKDDIRDTAIRKIEDTMTEAKGGWKALAAAGAIGGVVVGAITKALPFLGG